MKNTRILDINLGNREKDVPLVRNILSESKGFVRSSEGLLEATEEKGGLMMIELKGEPAEMDKVENLINRIEGISVKSVAFYG